MAIVRDFYLGPTHILIDDRVCKNVTREQAEEIMRNLSKKIQLNIYLSEKASRIEERRKAEAEGHSEIPEGMEEFLAMYYIKADDLRKELEYRDEHGRDTFLRGQLSRYLYGEIKLLLEKMERDEAERELQKKEKKAQRAKKARKTQKAG